MNDKQLKQAILFSGIVSFFLGKKALEGVHGVERYHEPSPHDDPVVKALQAANGWAR